MLKRNLFFALILATAYCLLPTAAPAQTVTGDARVRWVSALPSTCVTTDKAKVLVYKYTATTGVYYCSAANTWTQVGTGTPSFPTLASDGSAAAPAYSFSSDTDVGMYRIGANTLGFATGGTLRGTLSSAGLLTLTGGISTSSGTFSSPITSTQGTITTSQPFITHTATWNDAGVTFANILSNVTSTGSATASKLIDLQVGGTTQFNVTKGGLVTSVGAVNSGNGTAAAPTFSFTSDPDTGVFRSGANALGFSTGGTERATLSSAGAFSTTGGVSTTTGTFSGDSTFATNLTVGETGTAIAGATGNVTVAGVVLAATGANAAAPAYTFSTDLDTGMFRSGANAIGFSTGGTERGTLSSAGLFTTTGGVSTTTGTFTGAVASSSATGGIGYSTGAGGAQTQATDKSTGVTSNTITTAVTMNSATLNAATTVAFTFTNSAIAATDTVLCTHQSAGTSAAYTCNAFPGAGSAVVSVRNITAGNLGEAIVLRITVIKSVSN